MSSFGCENNSLKSWTELPPPTTENERDREAARRGKFYIVKKVFLRYSFKILINILLNVKEISNVVF